MKIKSLHIKNFRCLVNVKIDFDDVTVLLGENNTGKTSVLDALQLITAMGSQKRKESVNEYDFYMPTAASDPKKSDPIIIEMIVEESKPAEWDEEIIQALGDILQTDIETEIKSINLKYSLQYSAEVKRFKPEWVFLTNGNVEISSSKYNLSQFLNYIPTFYLEALRNLNDEFSSRSQFWHKILRSLEIPEEQKDAIIQQLENLNKELLSIDPKLKAVEENLKKPNKNISYWTRSGSFDSSPTNANLGFIIKIKYCYKRPIRRYKFPD